MASTHRRCLCFARAKVRAAAANGRRSQSLAGTALSWNCCSCCLLGPGPALPGICISEGGSRKRRREGSVGKLKMSCQKCFSSVCCPCRTGSGSRVVMGPLLQGHMPSTLSLSVSLSLSLFFLSFARARVKGFPPWLNSKTRHCTL